MNKKGLFYFLILFLISSNMVAAHLMGGEITWTCLGNGKYLFQMNVFRDCNSVTPNPNTLPIEVFNHPTVSVITVSLISQKDISPKCNIAGPTITCGSPSAGAVEQFIYQS